MCINFTNESLHNLFIEHVFKLEQAHRSLHALEYESARRRLGRDRGHHPRSQSPFHLTLPPDPNPEPSRSPGPSPLRAQEVYIKEEVEWNFVAYEDNQPVIDLIAKRPICLLGLLDEQCAVGSGTDAGCLSNFHATFGGGGKMYAAARRRARS